MKKLLIILSTLFLINQNVLSQLQPVDSIFISKANYVSNFLSINEIVKRDYPHLGNKNIKLDSLTRIYVSRINKTENKKQYINILLEYFAELKNSHTGLYLKPYVINCSAKLVEKTLFVNWIEEEALKDKGVKKYDEIFKINDIPAIAWLEKEKKYVCASTDHDRENRAVWRVFSSEFNSSRKYEIKTKEGVKTINVSFNKLGKNESSNQAIVNSRIINDSIAYLKILSMRGNVVSEFIKEYKTIKEKPCLILDIRGNDGGSSGKGEEILSFLIKKQQRACVSRRIIEPKIDHYQGTLFVLIGVNTFSAAESFALNLYESGDATFIGSRTAGDTGNGPRGFSTEYGMTFQIPTRKPAQISFNGFPMEGVGIQPHYEINLIKEDYLRLYDTVLEYTIKFIEGNKRNKP